MNIVLFSKELSFHFFPSSFYLPVYHYLKWHKALDYARSEYDQYHGDYQYCKNRYIFKMTLTSYGYEQLYDVKKYLIMYMYIKHNDLL